MWLTGQSHLERRVQMNFEPSWFPAGLHGNIETYSMEEGLSSVLYLFFKGFF